MPALLPPGHGRSLARAVALVLVVGTIIYGVQWWGNRVPDDTSTEAFCDYFAKLGEPDPDAPEPFSEDSWHQVPEELRELGTPADASEQEREGMLLRIEWAEQLAVADEEGAERVLEKDPEAWQALEDYLLETCQ